MSYELQSDSPWTISIDAYCSSGGCTGGFTSREPDRRRAAPRSRFPSQLSRLAEPADRPQDNPNPAFYTPLLSPCITLLRKSMSFKHLRRAQPIRPAKDAGCLAGRFGLSCYVDESQALFETGNCIDEFLSSLRAFSIAASAGTS